MIYRFKIKVWNERIMVKFCLLCEGVLRKTRGTAGKIVLKCPNSSCNYEEPVEVSDQPFQKTSLPQNQVIIVDGSEKKFDFRPRTHIRCPQCGRNEAFFEQCQNQSTCDPSVASFQCTACNHKWTDTEILALIEPNKLPKSTKTKSN